MGISVERKAVLVRLLRGEVDADAAAGELEISRRALMGLRRRYLKSKLPPVEGTVVAPVDGPGQVRRDRWGVTHIKANCLADCYVGLGYAMAQDRLWHLDYRRRLAHGRLAEVLGSRYLASDRLHRVRFVHPISENDTLAKLFDLGPFETSGGTGTVRAAGYSTARPFVLTGLASYRMVVDLADPARAWATTTGGQSGHPTSPHYGDHAQFWLEDRYHPLLMDEKDIDEHLEGRLTLEPGE